MLPVIRENESLVTFNPKRSLGWYLGMLLFVFGIYWLASMVAPIAPLERAAYLLPSIAGAGIAGLMFTIGGGALMIRRGFSFDKESGHISIWWSWLGYRNVRTFSIDEFSAVSLALSANTDGNVTQAVPIHTDLTKKPAKNPFDRPYADQSSGYYQLILVRKDGTSEAILEVPHIDEAREMAQEFMARTGLPAAIGEGATPFTPLIAVKEPHDQGKLPPA